MPNVRVLLVVDRLLVRLGMRSILAGQDGIEVIGEAVGVERVVTLVGRLKPTVVIIDAPSHELDIEKLARRIIEQADEHIGILILANTHDHFVNSAIRSGANGLLLKQTSPAQLSAAVRMAAKGYYLLPPPADGELPLADSSAPVRCPPPERIEQLTERELCVFRLVSHGRSNAEIARDLALRESTVKSHVRSILTKLDLRNRVHIVIFAYRIGMFPGTAVHATSAQEPWDERNIG